jgi:hypothetical protein
LPGSAYSHQAQSNAWDTLRPRRSGQCRKWARSRSMPLAGKYGATSSPPPMLISVRGFRTASDALPVKISPAQLPSPGRYQEIRSAAARPVRRVSPVQSPVGSGDQHRGSAQRLHDPQHERTPVAGRRGRDTGDGGLRQVPVDRGSARIPAAWPRGRQDARARARCRSGPRPGYLRQSLCRLLPRPRRQRRAPQPADYRPRVHGSPAVGLGQLQRRRRAGALDHGGQFHSSEHAAWRRLPEPAAVRGGRLGRGGLRHLAASSPQGRP